MSTTPYDPSHRAARGSRPALCVNGKFLSASPTGVHRVAAELLVACDMLRAEGRSESPWRLLAPRDATRRLPLATIEQRQVGVLTWQPWEQLDLPLHARRSPLLSLCNLAPLMHSASVVMMHDAQVFASPASYGAKFRALYGFLQPRLGRRALQVLTVSEFSKGELDRFGVAPADKISVVHNGCDHLLAVAPDLSLVPKLGLDGRPFVVALANTQAHKNIGLLLQAFARPEMTELRLVLVGKADRSAFQAVGLEVPQTVLFAGGVSDAGFRALYEAALCLAFPSTTEGFGLPPLEAMSLGCPVISAPCGALPEVCGHAALYAPADDPAAWSELILDLAQNVGLRTALADAGRAQAEHFTWRRAGERLLEVLAGLGIA